MTIFFNLHRWLHVALVVVVVVLVTEKASIMTTSFPMVVVPSSSLHGASSSIKARAFLLHNSPHHQHRRSIFKTMIQMTSTTVDLSMVPPKNDTTTASPHSLSDVVLVVAADASEQKNPDQKHSDDEPQQDTSNSHHHPLPSKQPNPEKDILRKLYLNSQIIRTVSADPHPQHREEVIAAAWAAESSYRAWFQSKQELQSVECTPPEMKENDSDNGHHVFSILLKIWRDCTSVLADLHQQESYAKAADSNFHHPTKTKNRNNEENARTSQKRNNIIWDEDTIFSGSSSTHAAIVTAHDAAQHAEDLLLEFQPEPTPLNVYLYEMVLDTWVQSKYMDAHGKAQRLLDRIILRENNNNDNDIQSVMVYVYTMEAYCLSADTIHQNFNQICELYDTAKSTTMNNKIHSEDKQTVRLDNTMILALARMARRTNAETHHQNNNKKHHLLATVPSVTADDYVHQALKIFGIIQQPNIHSYEAILEALSRTGDYKTADRIFTDLRNETNCTPSIIAYTWLIHTYALAAFRHPNLPQRAMDLLQEILDPSSSLQPNAMLFNSVITCWVKSQNVAKAAKAVEILKLMGKLHVKPTVHVYNSALEACARTGTFSSSSSSPQIDEMKNRAQQLAALKIAFAIFKLVERDELANQVIFATMLKVVGNLLPSSPERNDIASKVFAKAVARGVVDGYVLACLKRAVDADVFHTLLAPEITPDHNGHLDFQKLPYQWSRNVPVK